MDHEIRATAARRFPLLGRPRPSCPSLTERIHDLAAIVNGDDTDRLGQGAHALNMAALIASDCGLPDLAHQLCWQHINTYRAVHHESGQPLTVLQTRYLLEPVLNLARLRIRANDGNSALDLLTAMYRAVSTNTDLAVDGETIPLTNLRGTRHDHLKLREWVWLQLLGDGTRALTLSGRWNDAVVHAQAHRGIGLHLMEGRQAVIIAHCLNDALDDARAALAECTPIHPWEIQVVSCLKVMCHGPDAERLARHIDTMIDEFLHRTAQPGYASYRTQLGLTMATLAAVAKPHAARRVLIELVDEVIRSGDGYAARDLLRHHERHGAIMTNVQQNALWTMLTAAGLGSRHLSPALLSNVLAAADTAAEFVRSAL
ncbi:MAG TPA: hypothetical protein VM677_01300 [Actinokineospora sp.]|nr:hypothetical protein [Actinokineospora sp.]